MQQRLVAARMEDAVPDTVLFMQHEPVVTLGRRGREDFLLAPRDALRDRGIHLAHASRGGDVTYHGPGQWVMYPIIKLGTHEADAHGYLHNLEDVAIKTAARFGVEAYRREGLNGAWAAAGKIAAIGFRLTRWVTSHGMSLNVKVDLAAFDLIVGCGLVGEPVSSLEQILGQTCPGMDAVRAVMAENFSSVCGRPMNIYAAGDRLPQGIADALKTPEP